MEGKPLAYIATGAIYWVHGDHLGTPQVLTDAAGTAVWDADYRPFGAATVTGALTFNLRFPGQYEDAETGLHYNYFRDYDPTTGRYIQSDPIGLQGGWNTFAYVGGNPVMRVDPTGKNPVVGCAWGAVAGPVGCGAGAVAGILLGGALFALSSDTPQDDTADDSDDRAIPIPVPPRNRKCCTCTCRADANDNIKGNINPGDVRFAFGTATANGCAAASKEAKRIATHALGKQPKHVPCKCSQK